MVNGLVFLLNGLLVSTDHIYLPEMYFILLYGYRFYSVHLQYMSFRIILTGKESSLGQFVT